MGIRFRKTKKAGPFRFSLTKKGVGWSIGNKYIGYSHGASGRKSLRASIPATGISYITPIGGKKKRKKVSAVPQKKRNVKVTTEIIDHTSQYRQEQKQKNTKGNLILAGIVCGIMAITGAGVASVANTQDTNTPEKPSAGVSREIITETQEIIAETQKKMTETLGLLTNTPEKETPPTPIETEPEPEPAEPETQSPAVVETDPPETEPQITITHSDSSLSPELVKALDGVAAFWAPSGNRIHLNPFCWTLQEVVYAGTVEEANSVKDGGWCGTCSKNANENTKSNVNATPKVIAGCYSYQDYLNQIPATAFD